MNKSDQRGMATLKPYTCSPEWLREADTHSGTSTERPTIPLPSAKPLWKGRVHQENPWEAQVPVVNDPTQRTKGRYCRVTRYGPRQNQLSLEGVTPQPSARYPLDSIGANGTVCEPNYLSEFPVSAEPRCQLQIQSENLKQNVGVYQSSSRDWSDEENDDELFRPGPSLTEHTSGDLETEQRVTDRRTKSWNTETKEFQTETVRFRCTPVNERVRLCTLSSVGHGWLPLRKRAVVLYLPKNEQRPNPNEADPKRQDNDVWLKAKTQEIRHTDGKVIEHCANSMGLRSWRFPSQSSPNISESAEESWPLHQRNAPSLWRDGWEEREKETDRGRRASPSLSNLNSCCDPYRSESSYLGARTILSRTLSMPDTLPPSSSTTLTRGGFSSITITARRVVHTGESQTHQSLSKMRSVSADLIQHSPMSAMTPSEFKPSLAERGSPSVTPRRKAAVVKMTEYSERYWSDERPRNNSELPDHERSYAEGRASRHDLAGFCGLGDGDHRDRSSSSSSAPYIFRSCAHLQVPCLSASSTLYLDKSLSVPLVAAQGIRTTLHRSTLSLNLRGRSVSQTLVDCHNPRPMTSLERSQSEWSMADASTDRMRGLQSCHWNLMGPAMSYHTAGFRDDSDLGSDVLTASFDPLPFRGRCHSSSAAFRLKGNANDASASPQSNLRGDKSVFGKSPAPVMNNKLDSPVIAKRNSTMVKMKWQTEQEEMPNGPSARNLKTPPHSDLSAAACTETWCDDRGVSPVCQTNTALCSVSTHVENCRCKSRSDQHNYRHRPLSLKEALELFRPDFITRSQSRVRRLEQKAQERRSLQSLDLKTREETSLRRRNCTKPHPLSDNLFKPRERAISDKEMQLRSRRIYNKLPEVTRKKEEERRRLVSQTNRLRAEVFKKKLLDQILQRNSD